MHVDRLRFLVRDNKWLLPQIGELVKAAPELLAQLEAKIQTSPFDPTKLSDGELIQCLEEMRRRDRCTFTALTAGERQP